MKKTILSMITMMVLGTTMSFGSTVRHGQDDNTPKCEQCDKNHHDGDHKGGPRHPKGPRIQPTEGCKCKTCEQIRKMEQEHQKHMQEHKMHMDSLKCKCK